MHPADMLLPKHIYKVMCPCDEGLECVGKDGIVGKLLGTCKGKSTDTKPSEEEFE